jgi:hypothetical protein
MADHALVVGCNRYRHLPNGDLRGAVPDAVAVADWLTRPGGPVAPGNLTFLASSGNPADLDARVTDEAERGALADAVESLIERRDVSGRDRLYFYFAGHGLRTDPLNPMFSRDVLALTDFRRSDPGSTTVGVEDLVRKLAFSRFGIVVVITDACRNLLFDRPFQPAPLGLDPEFPADRDHFPRAYLLQATVPGGRAHGSEVGDGVRGDFTQALISGLLGEGTAKEFDETQPLPYLVRWSTLAGFVEQAARHQQPRVWGEGDFVLASFPDGTFGDVRLTVSASGGGSQPLAVAVQYRDPASPEDRRVEAFGATPLQVPVPPRRHRVVASTGGRLGWQSVDAYTDLAVELDLRALSGPTRDGRRRLPVLRSYGRGALVFRSDDPAAVGQVFTLSGRLVGRLLDGGQLLTAEGPYSGIRLGPEGRHRRSPIDVLAAADTTWQVTDDPGPIEASGNLRWASPAALLAREHGASLPERSPGAGLCLRGDSGNPPGKVTVHRADGGRHELPLRHEPRPAGGWIASADAMPDGRAAFDHLGHRLAVPVRQGVVTAVVLGATLCAGLFDKAATRADDRELLLIDRTQRLLAAGYPEAADFLLSHVDRRIHRLLPRLLHEDEDLAARIGGGERPYLLAGGPWAVLSDHPGCS